MRTHHFIEGLQAIEWTMDERGLGGLSDLEGLPWTMQMERFFEAWIETVFAAVARQTGARTKAGRLFHKASLSAGSRSLLLWLTAVPMATKIESVVETLSHEVRSALR